MIEKNIQQTVRTLYERGKKKKEIARLLSLDPKTVRKILGSEEEIGRKIRGDKKEIDITMLERLYVEITTQPVVFIIFCNSI